MSRILDYHSAPLRQPSRLLAVAAHVLLIYPLLLLTLLYGEWFLAWHMLGHEPRPSLDDPKFISGSSWMHPITALALLGVLPAGFLAVALNALWAVDNRLRTARVAIQGLILLVLWLGMILVLKFDPQPVIEWWFD